MAVVKIPSDNVTLTDAQDVTTFLAVRGIEYERWTPTGEVPADAPAEAVLEAYAHQIAGAEAARRVCDGRRDRRQRRHAQPRRHAREVQQGTLARRGRGAVHHRRARPLPCQRRRQRLRARSRAPAISFACRAARITGSICAPRSASAPFACSRIPRAGRRTTPRAASTADSNRSALVLPTSGLLSSRTRRECLRLCAWPPRTSISSCSTSRAQRRPSRSCTTALSVRPSACARVSPRNRRVRRRDSSDRRGSACRASRFRLPACRWKPETGSWQRRAGRRHRQLRPLVDRSRSKSGPLKALQGRIWEEGYATGALQGEVYPDVRDAFVRWTAGGRRIGIFSSGSVLAQRLLFGCSTAGDLSSFLSGYFDTAVGAKGDADSYRRIVAALSVHPSRTLFVSDVVKELDAARDAGLRTLLCVRPPADPAASTHDAVVSFDAIEA